MRFPHLIADVIIIYNRMPLSYCIMSIHGKPKWLMMKLIVEYEVESSGASLKSRLKGGGC